MPDGGCGKRGTEGWEEDQGGAWGDAREMPERTAVGLSH